MISKPNQQEYCSLQPDVGEKQSDSNGMQPVSLRTAFSLIELLIAIAVIAILIAIAVPTLSHTRESARRAANLSNLRQVAAGWSAYSGESGGMLPYFVDPKVGVAKVAAAGLGGTLDVQYFEQAEMWAVWLGKSGHAAKFGSSALFTPWTTPAQRRVTSYFSPCGGRVDPAHYLEQTFKELPEQLRAIGIAEAMFPASKALLTTRMPTDDAINLGGGTGTESRWGQGSIPAAMIDGHALDVRSDQILLDWGGDGFVDWHGSHRAPTLPLMHGTEGIRGRDIRS